MSNLILALVATLAALSALACSPKASEASPLHVPVVRNRGDSMVSVLANPEKYYDRRVSIVGFAHFEFKRNALFLHREDFDLRIMTNSIWLDRADLDQSQINAADEHYALVSGKYVRSDGHMGCCVGTITEIDTLEAWPLAL